MSEHNHTGLDEAASVASNTMQAVRTGKTISAAAKGAAAGGPYGAAIGAALSARKHIGKIAAAALVLLALPLLFILLLPGIIFGSLTDSGASGVAGQPILNDNAARPCRNVGSTIRFPYESDKRTKSTGWSNWSGDAGRRAHRDHGGTNHREHFAGQLSKTCGGDWWRDAYHRLCSRRNTDRAATYTQCALYAAATQAANRSGIAASGGKPAPRHRRNAKRRFCAATVWRTATRQEWYSKPHGSFSGCTAA